MTATSSPCREPRSQRASGAAGADHEHVERAVHQLEPTEAVRSALASGVGRRGRAGDRGGGGEAGGGGGGECRMRGPARRLPRRPPRRTSSKFARNIAASSWAFWSYASGSPMSSAGRAAPARRRGPTTGPRSRRRRRCGSRRRRARRRVRRGAAPRVAWIGIRCPSPNGPPVQPVLTSHTAAPWRSSFSPSIRAYTAGRLRQERRAEAGREGRLRLLHADLRAGELRGEAREEVVHRLVAREPRDRRQDPERVRREHHDGARMSRAFVGSAFEIRSSL